MPNGDPILRQQAMKSRPDALVEAGQFSHQALGGDMRWSNLANPIGDFAWQENKFEHIMSCYEARREKIKWLLIWTAWFAMTVMPPARYRF